MPAARSCGWHRRAWYEVSFWNKLVGGRIAEPIEAIGNAVDKVFTSDDERLTHAEIMERIRNEPLIGQIVTNQLEAQHRTVFVAGWRPAIGWTCAAALANYFLLNPWLQWFTGKPGPEMEISTVIALITSLLGVATLRTIEKSAGVAQ